MVGPTYDCVANPLGAVRLTFEKAMAASDAALDSKDWGAVELFRHFLSDQSLLSQVPVINKGNLTRIPPKILVRFRGMIQDMLGNEFYVGAYKDGAAWRTNKYSDVSQFPMGSLHDDEMRIWERSLLYCIPVPGLSPWAEVASDEAIEQYLDLMSHQRDKRSRMDIEASDHEGAADNVEEDIRCAKKMRGQDNNPSSPSTSMCSKAGEATSSAVPDVFQDSFSCLVKIYDSSEPDLKLNEVFEFIGVLTFDSEFVSEDDANDELDDMLVHLPSNKVPCLHCIVHRKLAVNDFLTSPPATESKLHLVKDIREALLRQLTSVLGNDGLAAHFMLLHLLSRVQARADSVAVGKLALNLTCFNKESISVFGCQLHAALESLLPFTSCIPLTMDYLNTASLASKKDYQVNRLIPGVLQLAESSHIMFDETCLEPGILNSIGVENAKLLKYLVEFQKVEYDFVYYKMEMAADIQVLVLSEGKSNILPADIVLPFRPSSGGSSQVPPASEALAAWRWYLATMRSLPHSIDPEMQKVVESDLVAARQADRSLGTEDFSRWLTMGRLISASFGETSLSLEHWQMVKELERQRRDRLH